MLSQAKIFVECFFFNQKEAMKIINPFHSLLGVDLNFYIDVTNYSCFLFLRIMLVATMPAAESMPAMIRGMMLWSPVSTTVVDSGV